MPEFLHTKVVFTSPANAYRALEAPGVNNP